MLEHAGTCCRDLIPFSLTHTRHSINHQDASTTIPVIGRWQVDWRAGHREHWVLVNTTQPTNSVTHSSLCGSLEYCGRSLFIKVCMKETHSCICVSLTIGLSHNLWLALVHLITVVSENDKSVADNASSVAERQHLIVCRGVLFKKTALKISSKPQGTRASPSCQAEQRPLLSRERPKPRAQLHLAK